MDTTGFSQVGRYGTLSLMKRSEPDTIVTAFGIDTEELTFGRDPSCSVRLYYLDINLVHCKITFEERKAFLVVLGSTGLLVDGCRVYPNGTPGGQPTTIPLSNNSEIEIRNKRFRFTYPPKEIRAALLATPARGNRKLRLSMIHSAQVFSPRPSKDPRENLRILQSPMKNAFRSPMKPSALSRSPITAEAAEAGDDADEEEEIVLVDGNHPRVVEEDKDLVILEDVEVPPAQPVVHVQPPKTPQRRRSQSLHRVVLIRSAQRAILEHERQRREEEEEREEEMEVLDTIASDDMSSDEDPNIGQQDKNDCPPSDEETDSDEDDGEEEANQGQQKPLWRKSLERLWPFRSPSPTNAEVIEGEGAELEKQDEGPEEVEEDEGDDGGERPETLLTPHATPVRRPLGSFMTPQVTQKPGLFDRGQSIEPNRGRLGGGPPVRYSMGGEARRIPLESAWRVRDIVIPLKGEEEEPKPPATIGSNPFGTPRPSHILGQAQSSPTRPRPEVSAEERRAIQERRRSALREVDSYSYFGGGIPGLSPSKASASPTKPGFNDLNNPFRPVSPTKRDSIAPIKDIARRLSTDEEDEKLDTRSLLERMKETVEGMKRRRSTIGGSTPSPVKSSSRSSLSEEVVGTPLTHIPPEDEGAEKKNDAMDVDEPSALLQSADKDSTSLEPQADSGQTHEPGMDDKPIVPVIVEETITDERNQLPEESAKPEHEPSQLQARLRRSRTRSRSPQPPAELAQPPVARRTRKATAEPEETHDAPIANAPKRTVPRATKRLDQETAPAPVQVAASGPSRRVRKPAAKAEETQATGRGHKPPTGEEDPAQAAKRTAKKAAVKEEEDKTAVPPPPRRGRPPKAMTATGSEQESNDAMTRPAARTRGTRATPVEVDNGDGDDPLDSFNSSEHAATEELPPAPVPAKAATKVRKARAGVKQEPEPTEALKTTTTRSRAAAATKTPAPTRSRPRKTPATAPAATQVEVDKENEPGTRATGGPSRKTTGDTDEGVVVKVRSTRKTKTGAVKQEAEEAAAAAQPKSRTTRATRARTKTT